MGTPTPARLPVHLAMEPPSDVMAALHLAAYETGHSKVDLVSTAVRLVYGSGDVPQQMALDAIQYRKLMGECHCECGNPCQACVIDAQRLREYRAALAVLGGAEPLT